MANNIKIDKKYWHVCAICSVGIQDLAKQYGGCHVYYTQVFLKHLEEDHKISPEEYFESIIGLERPSCACGICGQKTNITRVSSSLFWREYQCGRYKGTLEWSENARTARRGLGNPMYQKEPWNLGLTAETDERQKLVRDKAIGRKATAATRKKQSESAKKRKIHGHTGCKHSTKVKEASRRRTLQMIKNGAFGQTDTKPVRIFQQILDGHGLQYRKEELVDYWSFDFYLIDYNLFIEIDGDYFHSNPRRWTNGPKSRTQKINHQRDIAKEKFCADNNIKLIRFWEYDIIHSKQSVMEILLNEIRKDHQCQASWISKNVRLRSGQ